MQWDRKKIWGYLPEERRTIVFREPESEYFTLEFVRKFALQYPSKTNLIAFTLEGELSRYEDGLSDEELLARIRLETLDTELMKRTHGDDWEPSR